MSQVIDKEGAGSYTIFNFWKCMTEYDGVLIVCVLCLLAQGKASNEVSLKLYHINLADQVFQIFVPQNQRWFCQTCDNSAPDDFT